MERKYMSYRILAIALALVVCASLAAAAFARTRSRYLPEYNASGELILPKNFHEWIYVGSPLTPNALNDGKAGFPEYHNVYMEPGSYEIYKKTKVFPEGTSCSRSCSSHCPGKTRMARERSLRDEGISLAHSMAQT
jgi:hypothetical protein